MIRGKVVLVTGSSRGIGFSTATEFAKEGCKVVICSRKINELKRAEKAVRKYGTEILAIKCDLRKYVDVKKLFEIIMKRFGRIDFVINNAGVLYDGPIESLDQKEIDEMIDTNLKGLVYCVKEAIKRMRKSGGIIVNVASGAGHYSFENLSVYCATKFGVNAITTAVAKEVDKYGIKVFSICPGATRTEMQERFVGKDRYKIARHLMIKPEKISRKIVEISKGEADISSGSCLNVYF